MSCRSLVSLRCLGIAALSLSSALVAACSSDDASSLERDEPPVIGQDTDTVLPAPGGFGSNGSTDSVGQEGEEKQCGKMDIVFVVDNSGSMSNIQNNLAENFPKFGKIIDGYKTESGTPLDYRLAVLTTDTGDKGAFVRNATTSCNPGPDRAWLDRSDGTPGEFFACRARVGTKGSGDEQPLESLRLALTDGISSGVNTVGGEGFLREDALLAFVIITDEDEDSKVPIETYPAAFDTLKDGERGRWSAAVIAGETRCRSDFGTASEAKKLKQFISTVGENGSFSSICQGDLTVGLLKALDTFDHACQSFPPVTDPK